MNKTKIFFYEHFKALEQKLNQNSKFEIFTTDNEDLSKEKIFNCTDKNVHEQLSIPFSEIECLILRTYRTISLKILDYFPNLKVILRPGHGYDNIDVPSCTSHNVYVFNTAGVYTDATADLTIGLILNNLRHIKDADILMRQGLWERENLIGTEFRGLKICVVGLGRVGSAVARRLLAFGCKILAVDPYKNSKISTQNLNGSKNSKIPKLSNWEENYFRTVPDISDIIDKVEFLDMESALRSADVVTLHIPLTLETENLITANEFNLMKPGSMFVNAARGKIVDETALYDALSSKHLGCAAIDTFTVEPSTQSPLLKLDNFTATPHLGSQTQSSIKRVVEVSNKILEKTLIEKDYSEALNYHDIERQLHS